MLQPRRTKIEMVIAALVLSLAGCTANDLVSGIAQNTGNELPKVSSVSVFSQNGTAIVGTSIPLTAVAYNAAGIVIPNASSVSWSSGNSAVGEVSQAGVFTALTVGGPVVVTATIDGRSGQTSITVVPTPAASVTISPVPTALAMGATVALTATVRDATGNVLAGKTLQWSSSNALVAQVSQAGLVTGVAVGGPVTITASTEGRSGTIPLIITPSSRLELVTQPPTSAQTMYPLDRTPVVRAFDAGGKPITTAQITASIATPGYAVRTGAVESIRADGLARFSSLSMGVAPGYEWGIRGVDTVRLRFDSPGMAPLYSDIIQFSCFQRQIPVDRSFSYDANFKDGDCLLGNWLAHDFFIDIPKPATPDADNAVSLLVQTASADWPTLQVEPNGARPDEIISHSNAGFSVVRNRFILGPGITYFTESYRYASIVSYSLSASVQPDDVPSPCDVDRTYIPMQSAISFTQTLTTSDCRSGTAYVDFYYVELAPGATISFSAEGLGGATPLLAGYRYQLNSNLTGLFNATLVVNGTVSDKTNSASVRNTDVNTRTYAFAVYATNPASVGRYRTRVSFSRP
ncbi:MAG: Ig-like domain-containing protein [Gemmatimonadaceae bacterium]